MSISINHFDPGKGEKFQDLWKALMKSFGDSPEDRTSKPFDLEIPAKPEDREVMKKRLMDLFRRGLGTMQVPSPDDPKMVTPVMTIAREPHIPTTISCRFNDSDLEAVVDSASNILPDVTDSKFGEAFGERVHGIIDLLALLINFHFQGRDTGATVRAALELGFPFQNITISKIPFEERVKVLKARRDMIGLDLRAAVEGEKLRDNNLKLFAAAEEKCSNLGLKTRLRAIARQFSTIVEKFNLHPLYRFQAWYVFLNGMNDLDVENSTEVEAFTSLADQLGVVDSIKDLQDAINVFRNAVKKKIQN